MPRNCSRRIAPLVAVLLALAVLATAGAQAQGRRSGGGQTQGQRPQGPRMDFSAMMYVELMWSGVAFAGWASNGQITSMRPTFQKAFTSRQALMEKARQSRDFSSIQSGLKSINATLDAKAKSVLKPDQYAALVKWRKEALALMNPPRPTGPPPQGTQGQRPQGGPGRGGGFMAAMYLDRMWNRIAFVVKASDAQLAKLKPMFMDSWKKRAAAIKAKDEKAIQAINDALKKKIATVLSAEQMKKLEERWGSGGPRGQGGPGGGNRPGGGRPGGGRPH